MKTLSLVSALALGLATSAATAQVIDMEDLPTEGAAAPDAGARPGQPLPQNAPIASALQPAFEGQTRAPAVVTCTRITVEVKTRNLIHPWGLAFIRNDQVVITEKPGAMRVVDLDSGEILGAVQGVPNVVYGADAGLLDIVADPDFASNRLVYFTYVEPRGYGANGIVVAKARLEDQGLGSGVTRFALADLQTVIRVEPGIVGQKHYGSRLTFDREGYLFVSLSERFFSPYRDEAQSLYSWAGKILRISTDGTAAPGNPFANDQTAENHSRPEIWSYGQRNPQGIAIHTETGDLWDGEHGPQGGDEINLIQRGANYGWPLVAYGTNYDGTSIHDGRTALEGTEQPRYYWDPAIAPGGMTFYSGDLVPEWKNDLFVAALAGQHPARLVVRGDRIVGEERLLQDQKQRIRDVKQGPDGALWVITDDAAGRLLRIAPPADAL